MMHPMSDRDSVGSALTWRHQLTRGTGRWGLLVAGLAVLSLLTALAFSTLAAAAPIVHVRWAEEASIAAQSSVERRHGLADPEDLGERTVSYALQDTSDANIRGLLSNPLIEDTGGIDRASASVPSPGFPRAAWLLAAGLFCVLLLAWTWWTAAGEVRIRLLSKLLDTARGAWAITRTWAHWLFSAATRHHALVDVAALSGIVVTTLVLQIDADDTLTNDHAGYLAMARQMVLGDLPIRDFVEQGTFLHIALSAFVQRLFGFHLLGEMGMSWLFIAFGNCLTYHLACRAAGSRLIGLGFAAVSTLLLPLPYSFPKIFVYSLGILAMWHYIDRPVPRRLALVGFSAAVALMFRVDHGAVVLISAGLVVVLHQIGRPLSMACRRVGQLIGFFVLFLLPFLIYVQSVEGVISHFRTIAAFGLRTQLVHDESLGAPTALDAGIIAAQDETVLYELFGLIVIASMILAVWMMIRDWVERRTLARDTLKLTSVVLTSLLAVPMLARGSSLHRMADIAPVVVVLGGWLCGYLTGRRERPSPGPAWAGTIVAMGLIGALLVVPLTTGVGVRLRALARQGVLVRSATVLRNFAISPPLDGRATSEFHGVASYVHNCTLPSDRVFVTFYAPEIYVLSNRQFAGDQWAYFDVFRNEVRDQQHVIELVERQSVPLVLLIDERYRFFEQHWELVANHFAMHYTEIGTVDGVTVLARLDRPRFRSIGPTALPCFIPNGGPGDRGTGL